MNELRACVDINLTQNRVPRVNKAVWRVCGNDYDTAGFHFARVIAHRDGGGAFECERHFDIRMRVQWRTLAWLRIYDIGRERRALLFANKFIRHSDKRELLEMQKAHDAVGSVCNVTFVDDKDTILVTEDRGDGLSSRKTRRGFSSPSSTAKTTSSKFFLVTDAE